MYLEIYIWSFELKNIDTGKVFTGKLSTKGVLEFKDIEYGTYRAVEKDDRYFAFAHMLEIQSVLGVKFTPDNNGGTITISPTGSNIIYTDPNYQKNYGGKDYQLDIAKQFGKYTKGTGTTPDSTTAENSVSQLWLDEYKKITKYIIK